MYMLLCEDFVKFDVSTNQNHSGDNSKVSTFLHSDVFTAFWSFPSYLDHYLITQDGQLEKTELIEHARNCGLSSI